MDERNGTVPENPIVEVLFNLYQSDLDYLDRLVAMNPMAQNKAEALRSAIATEIFLRDKVSEGVKIILEGPDGSLSQILIQNSNE